MLDFAGSGMLALWNGVDPARRAEYDLWHTREHVPERLALPGMLGARRYVRPAGTQAGPLPQFLTLYAMRDTSVLTSQPYLDLLANPTPWSRSMRPSFRGYMRLCCHRQWSGGGGAGGALAAVLFEDDAASDAAPLRRSLAALLPQPATVAAHLLIRDTSVPEVPFAIGGAALDFPRGGALLVESTDEDGLDACAATLGEELTQAGLGGAIATFTCYRLAYAIDRESRARLAEKAPA
jgi:hypothetical protein